MYVDLGGGDGAVPQEILDELDVHALLVEQGGEGVAEDMRCDGSIQACKGCILRHQIAHRLGGERRCEFAEKECWDILRHSPAEIQVDGECFLHFGILQIDGPFLVSLAVDHEPDVFLVARHIFEPKGAEFADPQPTCKEDLQNGEVSQS